MSAPKHQNENPGNCMAWFVLHMPASTQSLREFSRGFRSGIFEGFHEGFWEGLAEVVAQGFAMLEKPLAMTNTSHEQSVPQQMEGGTTGLHWCTLSVQVWVYCFCTVGPNRMTSWNFKLSTGVCDVPNKHSNEVYGRFATAVGTERSQIAQIAPKWVGESAKGRLELWCGSAETSLALVQKRFALVRTALAPVRETFPALPLWSPKPPLALSPNHFGAIWAIWLLSVPTGVAMVEGSETAKDMSRREHQWPPLAHTPAGLLKILFFGHLNPRFSFCNGSDVKSIARYHNGVSQRQYRSIARYGLTKRIYSGPNCKTRKIRLTGLILTASVGAKNTNFYFSNFSGTAGISQQKGHIELFGPHPFMWKTPAPTGKEPDSKVWVCALFFVPELDTTDETMLATRRSGAEWRWRGGDKPAPPCSFPWEGPTSREENINIEHQSPPPQKKGPDKWCRAKIVETYLSKSKMTGRRFHRTMDMIPCPPLVV